MSHPEVVRVFATTQDPDHDSPWQARTPSSSTGSGVVIGPGESEPTDVWANGHFRWQFDHGSWTISRGEGPLAGLHAQGGMALVDCDDDSCTFALSGTYHVEG